MNFNAWSNQEVVKENPTQDVNCHNQVKPSFLQLGQCDQHLRNMGVAISHQAGSPFSFSTLFISFRCYPFLCQRLVDSVNFWQDFRRNPCGPSMLQERKYMQKNDQRNAHIY